VQRLPAGRQGWLIANAYPWEFMIGSEIPKDSPKAINSLTVFGAKGMPSFRRLASVRYSGSPGIKISAAFCNTLAL
ncbi:MAG: hypothetical protein QME90_15675, partial [Thermodesulfobacteriota bacterium]|nr:hypothetical protein [Thermodesulfobacteriota bacterium]